MNICVLWIGAFWFAILDHLSRKSDPNHSIFAYEKNETTFSVLKKTRKSPHFFPDTQLSESITFIENLWESIQEMDIIIVAIPNQYIPSMISNIWPYLKEYVCIVNVSKGINNTTLETVSDQLKKELWTFPYHYGVLSGGMIAQEMIDKKILWADIGVMDHSTGILLKELFESPLLSIHISESYKNIELFWALKNLIALYIGYLEGKWNGASTLGYYFCQIIDELKILLPLLWGSSDIRFSDFSLGWDLIATCFWDSRNRYLWKLLWSGKTPGDAMNKLISQNKRAEWYETLRGLSPLIRETSGLIHFKALESICFPQTGE